MADLNFSCFVARIDNLASRFDDDKTHKEGEDFFTILRACLASCLFLLVIFFLMNDRTCPRLEMISIRFF